MEHDQNIGWNTQRILQERARALAHVNTQAATAHREEIVLFRLGNAGYGIPARFVREIQPLQNYTPLVSTPPFIVGLVNVRGKLVTALDVRPLLNLPPAPMAAQALLMLVNVQDVSVGIVADAVLEVRHGDPELSPALSAGTGRTAVWVRGVDQQLNVILDPAGLLRDSRLIVNDAAE